MNLYELTDLFVHIQELMENGAENLEDTLESLECALEDKADGYGRVIKNIETQSNALKSEIERLEKRKTTLDNNINRMKLALRASMILANKEKLATQLFSFSIQKNKPSVHIVDEKKIAKKYYIKQAPKLDKKAIIVDLKIGKKLKWAELQQTKSLRIK
jgi:hypothetical protein